MTFTEAADLPLPDVQTVMKRLTERAKEDRQRDAQFERTHEYVRTQLREERSVKGVLKDRSEKRVDHKPVPDGTESPGVAGGRGRRYDRRDFSINAEMLGRFEFTVAARETVEGRPALRLEFRPRSEKLPENGLLDRFINRTAGELWVDEQDATISRARLRLTEKINVVGGVFGAIHSFEGNFLRGRTADGEWYPSASEWKLDGRQLFSRKVIEFRERREQVRRVTGGESAAGQTPRPASKPD